MTATEFKYLKEFLKAALDEWKASMMLELNYATKALRQEREQMEQVMFKYRFKDKISLTLQEAADASGMSYSMLYMLVKRGHLKASQIGGKKGKVCVLIEDMVELLRKNVMDRSFKPHQNNKKGK